MTLAASLAGAAWLTDKPVARLFEILDCDGEEARAVGGAVRDALMDRPVGDIDVATTALPQEVVRRAERANIKSVPTGIEHGTVTLIVEGQPFEVTTLREDVETFGRRAKVAFGRNWQHDAQRRDFTINALSASRDGKVHDYVGGLADLEARRVRFIGDAATRIAEDYLRIMRFFRFHAAFGEGAPDAVALAACIAARQGLDTLSRERVRSELLKLLIARRAPQAAAVMADAGLLTRILGGVPLVASLARMAEIERSLHTAPDALRRLGALAVFVTEDAERLFQRLRLSNAEHQRLVLMSDGWWRIERAMQTSQARALVYRIGATGYANRTLLAWARSQDTPDDSLWQALAQFPRHWTPGKFPLAAADLIALGVARGPALGTALRSAEEAWIAADFPVDQAELSQIALMAAKTASQN